MAASTRRGAARPSGRSVSAPACTGTVARSREIGSRTTAQKTRTARFAGSKAEATLEPPSCWIASRVGRTNVDASEIARGEQVAEAARVRVIDLETAGNGPNDVCEIGWQDVVQAPDGRWGLDAERGSFLIDPGRPISPETMAIHHILDRDVIGAPLWKQAAASVLQPRQQVAALAAHRAAFERRYCTPRLCAGAPWICTWKCALRLWPHLPRFSNQMLRYQRMPVGLVHEIGLPAHRAMPDAYVTAHHLRDMLNEASLEQLLAWSAQPGLLPRVPAGSERGKAWSQVDLQLLQGFLKDRDADIRFTAEMELARREDKSSTVKEPPIQPRLL